MSSPKIGGRFTPVVTLNVTTPSAYPNVIATTDIRANRSQMDLVPGSRRTMVIKLQSGPTFRFHTSNSVNVLQHAADARGHRIDGERLGQHRHAGRKVPVAEDRILSVSSDKKYF